MREPIREISSRLNGMAQGARRLPSQKSHALVLEHGLRQLLVAVLLRRAWSARESRVRAEGCPSGGGGAPRRLPIGVMPLTSACEMFAPRVSSADTASARLRSTATRSGVLPTPSSGSTPMVLSSISSSAWGGGETWGGGGGEGEGLPKRGCSLLKGGAQGGGGATAC